MLNYADILREVKFTVEKNPYLTDISAEMGQDDWIYMQDLIMKMEGLTISQVEKAIGNAYTTSTHADLARSILRSYVKFKIALGSF
jgi:hypothetical protein